MLNYEQSAMLGRILKFGATPSLGTDCDPYFNSSMLWVTRHAFQHQRELLRLVLDLDNVADLGAVARDGDAFAVHLDMAVADELARREHRRHELGAIDHGLQAALKQADQVVVTSDNPRSEKPEAIIAEKAASAQGITKMKEAMSGAGGRTMVKLRIAEALKGKRIVLFPTSDSAINLQQTDVNRFLESAGLGGKRE